MFTGIMHLIFCFQFYYALYYVWNFIVIPENSTIPKKMLTGFGGRTRFLTYWGLVSYQKIKFCRTF